MSGLPTPEERAEALVAAKNEEPGGPWFVELRELADIATRAKPRLLILTHRGNAGCDQSQAAGCLQSGSEEQLLKEMKQQYSGNVVAAHDLDVY